MEFDYSKLRGKIKEVCGTQEEFAKRVDMSTTSLSHRLNGKLEFTQQEILKSLEVLHLQSKEIDEYFFKQKV